MDMNKLLMDYGVHRCHFSDKELYDVVAHRDVSNWPEGVAGVVYLISRPGFSEGYRRVIARKVLDIFATKREEGINPRDQEAVWECWKILDSYGEESTRKQYIQSRLNRVMIIPEDLKDHIRRGVPFQNFYHEFFKLKSEEWTRIPTEKLEDWLLETKKEFRAKLETLC